MNQSTTTSFAGTLSDGATRHFALYPFKPGGALHAQSVADTYSGGTTISAGTLTLGNTAALGTGGLTVSGGTLDLNANSITVGKPERPRRFDYRQQFHGRHEHADGESIHDDEFRRNAGRRRHAAPCLVI